MSKYMLDPIIRALVGVPQERLGVLLDVINKVGSAHGELWRIRLAIALLEEVQGAARVPEVPLDTLIRVDRSIHPFYPNWVKTVLHQDLERTGPVKYDLRTLDPWLHEKQKGGRPMGGYELFRYIEKNGILPSCLSLRDLEEIQKKGIEVFRRFFGRTTPFAWKSVVQRRDRDGCLSVPYLCENDDKVVVSWNLLVHSWFDNDPALRFAS